MTLRYTQRGGETSPRRHGRMRRSLAALAALAVLAALCFFLAPTKLGGKADYVVTYGVSMEPHFHAGDLVVVRARSSYRVGQVVAYQNRELGRIVLHRIIGRIGDRYVFKGDNNDFVDPYHPTRAELVGRLWLHVPRAGSALSWLEAPRHAAFTGGLAVALTLLLGGGAAGRRRRRSTPHTASARVPRLWVAESARPLLGAALIAALAFGLIAGVSYRRSTTRLVEAPGYVQQGTYAYSAHMAPSAVYPSGRLATGQTVFTKLVHEAQISFSYRLLSALPHTLHGSAQLQLELRSALGWTLPLPSPPARVFSGDSVQLAQTLDLPALETELSRYLARTGIQSDSFTLVATPRISVRGTVSGQPLVSAFEPTPLTFIVDPSTLRLAQSAGSAAPGQPAADPLHPGAAGTVARIVPRTIGLPGRTLPVASARRIARLGLLAALALAALALAAGWLGRCPGEAAKIRRRYSELLVSVTAAPTAPDGDIVDVESFDDLARVAACCERPILANRRTTGSDHFYITDNGTTYHYTPNTAAVEACSPLSNPAKELPCLIRTHG